MALRELPTSSTLIPFPEPSKEKLEPVVFQEEIRANLRFPSGNPSRSPEHLAQRQIALDADRRYRAADFGRSAKISRQRLVVLTLCLRSALGSSLFGLKPPTASVPSLRLGSEAAGD